jgi:hypothetical protein
MNKTYYFEHLFQTATNIREVIKNAVFRPLKSRTYEATV